MRYRQFGATVKRCACSAQPIFPEWFKMIDLHCHIIPGIDDGAVTLEDSIAMARIAVGDGISVTACTSHMFPGIFNNTRDVIENGMIALRGELLSRDIPLALTLGADIQLAPGIVEGLSNGSIPSINGGRYFLFEPPHQSAPPRIKEVVKEYCSSPFVPIITHPERLAWIEDYYDRMAEFVEMGAWMQLTAGSITGAFGKRVQYWSERMLDEGLVHVIASDGHNQTRRPPVMSAARDAVAKRLGEAEAMLMVYGRPKMVLEDAIPHLVPPPIGHPLGHQNAGPASSDNRKKEKSKRRFWPFG
jgi:protein-tyrosine phosphatase